MTKNWLAMDLIQYEVIELEIQLKHIVEDILTNIRCRKECIKHGLPEDSNLFLDTIQECQEHKQKIRKQLFVLELKHDGIWN